MTKNVIISIRGLQFVENESDMEPVEIVTVGEYYEKNGAHYIMYDEMQEGFTEVTHNVIKWKGNILEVRKKGLTNVQMVFQPDKSTVCYYQTPFGVMHMSIAATGMQVDEQEDTIGILVNYALSMNDAFTADCSIQIRICSKL